MERLRFGKGFWRVGLPKPELRGSKNGRGALWGRKRLNVVLSSQSLGFQLKVVILVKPAGLTV